MSENGSVVVIMYGTEYPIDITSHVMFETASFESQFSAIPGTFEFTVKDEEQTLEPFITGQQITLSVDGVLLYGGFLTQVSRKFAFPVDRTDEESGGPDEVKTRQWVLRGVDYNILFDKRVLRNNSSEYWNGDFSSYLRQLPSFYKDRMAGDLIRNELCPLYLDLYYDGIDYTSEVDDVSPVVPWSVEHTKAAWCQQGSTWRKQMEDFSQFNGAVWYITPDKKLFYKALEDLQSKWGFSDVPNDRPIDDDLGRGPNVFLGATYGFREMDATEDGSYIVNDALIWGGSEWAGSSGGTVFARATNEESIATHHRWQLAETHFGESSYGIQDGVDARAQTIVEGSPSQQEDQLYGLKYPQWQIRLAWFGNDVPKIGSYRQHLMPGQLVTMHLFTFGTDTSHPLILLLPLRQVKVSFPGLDADGLAYVRFDGFFGIQQSDPWTLWRYLLKEKAKTASYQITSVSNVSDRALYGSFGSFFPAETPDGSRTEFSIFITVDNQNEPIGYIEGTTAVYLNGMLQRANLDYVESDPPSGKITFLAPPIASDWIWIQCRTMAG